MKKYTLLLVLLISYFISHAADLNVDGSGAIGGSYSTISAAITAASDGDRIIIYNETQEYIENLTVNKSLTFIPATPENYFYVDGDISIVPANGREITIVGITLTGSLTSSADNGVGARCTVNVTDSRLLGYVTFDHANFHLNILYSALERNVTFRMGNLIGNECGRVDIYTIDSRPVSIFITDESATFGVGDTVKIIANNILTWGNWPIKFSNSSARYFIANNMLNNGRTNTSSSYHESLYVENCYIIDSANVFRNNSLNIYNSASTCGGTSASVILKGMRDANCVNNFFRNRTSSGCAMTGATGQFNFFSGWGSGGWIPGNQNRNITGTYTWDILNGVHSDGLGIDAGKPGIEYVDLDLTRNDIGTGGGPFSWWNYHAQDGDAEGRARVWHLDIQSAIHSLTAPVQIKGQSTHMK